MGYDTSIQKAWELLQNVIDERRTVLFLNSKYEVNPWSRTINPVSGNFECLDHHKILLLHYLANEGKVLDIEGEEWISFNSLPGGRIYYPTFHKRAIMPILQKYGDSPDLILGCTRFLDTEKIDIGSAAISIRAFPKIKVGIILYEKDEEFEADCRMLFNDSIKTILSTEDVAVLGGTVASMV
jgi:hypothetical protein